MLQRFDPGCRLRVRGNPAHVASECPVAVDCRVPVKAAVEDGPELTRGTDLRGLLQDLWQKRGKLADNSCLRPPTDDRDDLFDIPTGWRSREHAEFAVKCGIIVSET